MKIRKRLGSSVAFILIITFSCSVLPPGAFANQSADCRIKSSDNHLVSLGFPMRKERLSQIQNPKILVMPFQLKDEPEYTFTEAYKEDYKAAAKIVHELSQGKANIQFEFAEILKTDLSNADMEQQKLNQQSSWMTDPEKSTWGLVRRLIRGNDSRLDFRGVSAVILEGSTTSRYADINEAMSFQESPLNPWFKSIQTEEGLISNAILLDNHAFPYIIAHELMHLYGLTDLYGSGNGPGRLSLMSNMENGLLTFEKWVLGWHPDSQVSCLNKISENVPTEVQIDLNKGGHLVIIPTSPGSGYVLDISYYKGSPFVSFYLLNNELRPPIQLFQPRLERNREGLPLTDLSAVGQLLKGPDYSAIVTSLQENLLTVTLTNSKFFESNEGKILTEKALENTRISKPFVLPAVSQEKGSEQMAPSQKNESEKKQKSLAPSAKSSKKKTISCSNGKSTRRITGVNPVCPKGYKVIIR